MLPNIIITQDGNIANKEHLDFGLSDSDFRYSNNEAYINFTGFCINKKSILVSFPKHFFDDEELTDEKKEIYIKLLFETMYKYFSSKKSNSQALKYFGAENQFESDFPFYEFFKIYDYYKKYGIFKEEELILNKNGVGKISWKDTIQKSNVIINNGNLIFLPIFSKRKSNQNVFISECMKFVINYTIKNFNYFINLPLTTERESNFNFIENIDFTLRELYQYKGQIFKDYQKELLNLLISFFENYNKSKSGNIHFKIMDFNLIWQEMINLYLNEYFIGVDQKSHSLIFGDEKQNKFKFKEKEFNDVDLSINNYKIKPDHYYCNETDMYVFDSKYYINNDGLNYKQLAYTLILGNSELCSNKNIYSALLLPGKKVNLIHINLSPKYSQMKEGCNYIIEQYLDVKMIMKNYIN